MCGCAALLHAPGGRVVLIAAKFVSSLQPLLRYCDSSELRDTRLRLLPWFRSALVLAAPKSSADAALRQNRPCCTGDLWHPERSLCEQEEMLATCAPLPHPEAIPAVAERIA